MNIVNISGGRKNLCFPGQMLLLMPKNLTTWLARHWKRYTRDAGVEINSILASPLWNTQCNTGSSVQTRLKSQLFTAMSNILISLTNTEWYCAKGWTILPCYHDLSCPLYHWKCLFVNHRLRRQRRRWENPFVHRNTWCVSSSIIILLCISY